MVIIFQNHHVHILRTFLTKLLIENIIIKNFQSLEVLGNCINIIWNTTRDIKREERCFLKNYQRIKKIYTLKSKTILENGMEIVLKNILKTTSKNRGLRIFRKQK